MGREHDSASYFDLACIASHGPDLHKSSDRFTAVAPKTIWKDEQQKVTRLRHFSIEEERGEEPKSRMDFFPLWHKLEGQDITTAPQSFSPSHSVVGGDVGGREF